MQDTVSARQCHFYLVRDAYYVSVCRFAGTLYKCEGCLGYCSAFSRLNSCKRRGPAPSHASSFPTHVLPMHDPGLPQSTVNCMGRCLARQPDSHTQGKLVLLYILIGESWVRRQWLCSTWRISGQSPLLSSGSAPRGVRVVRLAQVLGKGVGAAPMERTPLAHSLLPTPTIVGAWV